MGILKDVSWYVWTCLIPDRFQLQGILTLEPGAWLHRTNVYALGHGDRRHDGQYVLVMTGGVVNREPKGFLAYNEFYYNSDGMKEVFDIVQRYEFVGLRLIDYFGHIVIMDEFAC